MRAFQNCLVCGASTENTHSARRGADALVCGGECYKQASRNFKRNMSGYKLARLVDLLAQMGEPVTAAELLNRYRETYGRSGMTTIVNSVALTSQLRPIVNPETIRVDKTKHPFTFEYLGGTTIGEWLKPSMRAKYESVSFRSEDNYEWGWGRTDLAPTELIKKRLKNAGFSMTSVGTTYKDQIVEFYKPQLVAPNGVVLEVCLSQNEEVDGFSRLTFFENDHSGDVGKVPDIDWNILHENGLLKGEDSVDYPQHDYYQVLWDGLYDEWKHEHNCADNAKFDIYEDNLIVMECVECGKTATFEQKTPYEGPRNAGGFRWFESESTMPKIPKGIKTGGWQQAAYIYPNGDIFSIEDFSEVYDMPVYDIWHYSGNMPKIDAPKNTWIYDDEVESWDWDKILDKAKNQANKEYDTLRAEEEKEYYIRYRPKFAMGYLLEGPFSNLEKAQDEARLMSLFKQKHRGVLGIQEGKTYPPNYVLTKSFCKMCGADSENPCVCMIGPEVKPCTNKVLKKWKSDAIAHFPCPCSIKMEKNAESEEEEDELRTYEVSVPVLHYYGIGPVEAYDEDEAVDEVRNNWRSHWRNTIEDNGDWGGPLWRYSRLSSHEPEAHEIFDSETFGAERQPELAVSVGDRVRSYDFVLPDGTLIRDDCYMEGRVTKIAPVDWCGAECDHYYILVEKIVRNGEELSERQPGVDMVYPPVSESYLEVINETFAAEYETFEVETDEYQGPFEVEIRRPNGSVVSWKKYENYRELIGALEDIVSNRYTPYAIDVFATKVSHISGFTAMGPVTDYRKFHLATWKYGNWESGPWAEHFPTGLE